MQHTTCNMVVASVLTHVSGHAVSFRQATAQPLLMVHVTVVVTKVPVDNVPVFILQIPAPSHQIMEPLARACSIVTV